MFLDQTNMSCIELTSEETRHSCLVAKKIEQLRTIAGSTVSFSKEGKGRERKLGEKWEERNVTDSWVCTHVSASYQIMCSSKFK